MDLEWNMTLILVRYLIAILSQAKIYGNEPLNLAVAYGVKHGTTSTRSIKSILEKKLYLQESTNAPINQPTQPSSLDTHENLRGNIYQ